MSSEPPTSPFCEEAPGFCGERTKVVCRPVEAAQKSGRIY